jgi:hypothetical protein
MKAARHQFHHATLLRTALEQCIDQRDRQAQALHHVEAEHDDRARWCEWHDRPD